MLALAQVGDDAPVARLVVVPLLGLERGPAPADQPQGLRQTKRTGITALNRLRLWPGGLNNANFSAKLLGRRGENGDERNQ